MVQLFHRVMVPMRLSSQNLESNEELWSTILNKKISMFKTIKNNQRIHNNVVELSSIRLIFGCKYSQNFMQE
jgi:hypothetical protein